MPPIAELTRIEPIHRERLARQGVFTTGLLLEVSETPTRRQTLADQVDASTNDVLRWRDEALLLNLAGFGSPEHDLFAFAGFEGLGAVLKVGPRHVPRGDRPRRRATPGRAAHRSRGRDVVGAGPNAAGRMTLVAAASSRERTWRLPAGLVVGTATILTLVGIAIGLFFNPVWVSFEQGRTRADLWTGYTPETVRTVTDSVLAEVYLGPGTFAQSVDGTPVFNERERAHMANVRGVVVVFFGLVLVAAAVLLVGGFRSRGAAWYWRAIARGSAVLAIGAVVVGIAFALAFEQAFTAVPRPLLRPRDVELRPRHRPPGAALPGRVLDGDERRDRDRRPRAHPRHLGVRATPRARGGLTC